MTTAVEAIPEGSRDLFAKILDEESPELLAALNAQERPTVAQQSKLIDVFSTVL